MSTVSKDGFRLTGWHVLFGLIGFFAVVGAADVYFATLAFRTFSGQVASNPYEAGEAFNETLERRAAQGQLGWRATVEAADRGGVILSLRDAAGAPLEGLAIEGRLTRPATAEGAQDLVFAAKGQGRYVAAADLSGAWDLVATATDAEGRTFELQDRIVEPGVFAP
jgi:nitrogen fixation protein FixH